MSVATFEKVLTKIRSEHGHHPRLFIDLYNWGEPSLHPNLSTLVRLAKEADFGVGLSSNLNVFPDLQNVIKAEPDYLRISFSGMHATNYRITHRGGSLFALKANMYRVRDLLDQYGSRTIVQAGYHIYRGNFPDDFLAARSLCDELGFLFAPVLASLMPAEKLVSMTQSETTDIDPELRTNLVLRIPDLLAVLREAGPATTDCQFRQKRTTINYDGSVSLCCATYARDKIIIDDFIGASRARVEAAKYDHPFCNTCMNLHINKLYTGMYSAEQNEAAAEVLGPIFRTYLDESRLIGDPDFVVLNNAFKTKMEVYERGMAAMSIGEFGLGGSRALPDGAGHGCAGFCRGLFSSSATRSVARTPRHRA